MVAAALLAGKHQQLGFSTSYSLLEEHHWRKTTSDPQPRGCTSVTTSLLAPYKQGRWQKYFQTLPFVLLQSQARK